jgi:chromosome segregation ATPase
LIVKALADHLLTPERLPQLLREANRHRRDLASGKPHRRSELRRRLKDIDKQIDRLLSALAERTVTNKPQFRSKLTSLEAARDETIRLLNLLETVAPSLRRTLSNQQAVSAAALKRRLTDAPKALQRTYVRGLVSEIVIDKEGLSFPDRGTPSHRRFRGNPSKAKFAVLYGHGAP